MTVTSTLLQLHLLSFEGTTDDDNETTLSVIDPTADRTLNLPNEWNLYQQVQLKILLLLDKHLLASGDIVSGNDELLVSDADASTFKRITVDNLISSAGGLTSVAPDTTPNLEVT